MSVMRTLRTQLGHRAMSGMGHQRTSSDVRVIASPQQSDIDRRLMDVRFGPGGDIRANQTYLTSGALSASLLSHRLGSKDRVR
jgi:hypothetical protein